jgi:hypothetical protein
MQSLHCHKHVSFRIHLENTKYDVVINDLALLSEKPANKKYFSVKSL